VVISWQSRREHDRCMVLPGALPSFAATGIMLTDQAARLAFE
jgi:hypothetical protein